MRKITAVVGWLKKNDVFDIFESAPSNQMHQMICMMAVETGLTYEEVSATLTEIENDPIRVRAFAMLDKIKAVMGEDAKDVKMEHGASPAGLDDYRIRWWQEPFVGGLDIVLHHDRNYPKIERWWITVRVVNDNRVQLKNVPSWVQSTDINDESECGQDVVERSWLAKEGIEDQVWKWCFETQGGTCVPVSSVALYG